MSTREVVLRASGIVASYGHVPVLRGVDLEVVRGEVLVLLGPNGAGKSTTMQALAGELPLEAGSVTLHGTRMTGPLQRRAAAGLAYLPEGRSVFRALSVRDNLKLGAGGVDAALAIAPELHQHLDRRAGLLSGGQQQIMCLARLLAGRPSVLLADEMSLGLAPMVVRRMLDAARAAADGGAGVLLVEQHAHQALAIADRAVVMTRGEIVLEDAAAAVLERVDELERHYLAGATVAATDH